MSRRPRISSQNHFATQLVVKNTDVTGLRAVYKLFVKCVLRLHFGLKIFNKIIQVKLVKNLKHLLFIDKHVPLLNSSRLFK